MKAYMSREHIESHLSNLISRKYNKFQWWRKYYYREELPDKAPLKQKILNGDYNPSDYIYQYEHEQYLLEDRLLKCKNTEESHDARSLFFEKMRRLNEDYQKDEDKIMAKLLSAFKRTFNFSKERMMPIMENFDGTLEELYDHVSDLYKKERNMR
jgi:hypothetical protein